MKSQRTRTRTWVRHTHGRRFVLVISSAFLAARTRSAWIHSSFFALKEVGRYNSWTETEYVADPHLIILNCEQGAYRMVDECSAVFLTLVGRSWVKHHEASPSIGSKSQALSCLSYPVPLLLSVSRRRRVIGSCSLL